MSLLPKMFRVSFQDFKVFKTYLHLIDTVWRTLKENSTVFPWCKDFSQEESQQTAQRLWYCLSFPTFCLSLSDNSIPLHIYPFFAPICVKSQAYRQEGVCEPPPRLHWSLWEGESCSEKWGWIKARCKGCHSVLGVTTLSLQPLSPLTVSLSACVLVSPTGLTDWSWH